MDLLGSPIFIRALLLLFIYFLCDVRVHMFVGQIDVGCMNGRMDR